MSRLGLFLLALAVAFSGAYALGSTVDPDAGDGGSDGHDDADTHGATPSEGALAARAARLVVDDQHFVPGARQRLTFRVVDRDGRTLDDFDVAHERQMHVIAARRDLTGYRHVHPRRTRDGGWAVDVEFAEAGPHRVFADFVSGGAAQTLAADVEVAGRYAARPLPAPATRAPAGHGYTVAVAAEGSERSFTVTRDGEPVDDIEPYLGARGHLVALRAGDLAFQHVHPKDRATAGRQISFDVELPGARPHRLFLQFKHEGEVHTAAFTEPANAGAESHGEAGHGH